LFSCSAPRKTTQPEIQASAAGISASLSSTKVVDGSLVVVDVLLSGPKPAAQVEAEFEKKKFALYKIDANHFQGMFGVPHSHVPGPAKLLVTSSGADSLVLPFTINDANYPSETLKVNNRKVHPRKKDMIRIQRETPEINAAIATNSNVKLWSGPFVHPTDTVTTDQFGMKRLYNGELRSYHGGMDFRAAVGTPIHAAGAGRVLIAKDLFFSGGTVMIDHGFGLITMYFHMSKIIAKQGQMVARGDLIGLSGKTGRVTGPHLHFQVDVHGTKVNPRDLFEELK
jgi:hypothetical protein